MQASVTDAEFVIPLVILCVRAIPATVPAVCCKFKLQVFKLTHVHRQRRMSWPPKWQSLERSQRLWCKQFSFHLQLDGLTGKTKRRRNQRESVPLEKRKNQAGVAVGHTGSVLTITQQNNTANRSRTRFATQRHWAPVVQIELYSGATPRAQQQGLDTATRTMQQGAAEDEFGGSSKNTVV